MDPILHVSCAPEPDAERIIGDGLNAFNDATVGYADRMPVHVLVSDPDSGKIVGGITGRTSLALMFIDLVYLLGNPTGSRYRCSHAGADGGRRASAWLPGGCSLHDQLPGTGVRCDPPGRSSSCIAIAASAAAVTRKGNPESIAWHLTIRPSFPSARRQTNSRWSVSNAARSACGRLRNRVVESLLSVFKIVVTRNVGMAGTTWPKLEDFTAFWLQGLVSTLWSPGRCRPFFSASSARWLASAARPASVIARASAGQALRLRLDGRI
jgi:hypothetical protein